MPFFVLIAEDKPDSLNVRLATREAHLDYMSHFKKQVRLAGPLLNGPDQSPSGSMIILEMASIEDAQAFAAQDPYEKAGLFSNVTISPYTIAIENRD